MLKPKLFFLVIISFWINSCSSEEHVNNTEQTSQFFFDLQSYFKSEINRLNEHPLNVRKEIILQGKEEKLSPKEIDFKKELQVFLNSDINKRAWQDKYQADSTIVGGKLAKVLYTATDTSLRTKLLEINFQNDAIQQIQIVNSTKSLVAETYQKLNYQPNSGYSIDNEQKTLFSKKQKLSLKVAF